MKQYTSKDQTTRLVELGFPRPQSIVDILSIYNEVETAYSIGELIEFLGRNLLAIGVTTILNLPIKHFVQFTKDYTKGGYTQVQGELIDKLFEACVTLKEKEVI